MKLLGRSPADRVQMFAPSRGRELKCPPMDSEQGLSRVRPLAGAGIEIDYDPNLCCTGGRFAPSRGRELKSAKLLVMLTIILFAPSRGRELKFPVEILRLRHPRSPPRGGGN